MEDQIIIWIIWIIWIILLQDGDIVWSTEDYKKYVMILTAGF